MNEIIITVDEIKLLTGISDSDAKVSMFNVMMTNLLKSALGVSQFGVHSIALEKIRIDNCEYIRPREFPIDLETLEIMTTWTNTELLTNYTFRVDPHDFRKVWILDESGVPSALPYDEIFANYDAGYTLQSTITVEDYSTLATKTLVISVEGVETTYTFVASGPSTNQIEASASNDNTATNIATALGGTAEAAVVTLPVGARIVSGSALTSELSYTNYTIPEELRLAVAYMVAGAISDKSQIQGVQSYKIGTKQVNLRDTTEKNFVSEVIKKYASSYKPINVIG